MRDAQDVSVSRVRWEQPSRDRGNASPIHLHGGSVVLNDVHDPRVTRPMDLHIVTAGCVRKGTVASPWYPLGERRAEHRGLAPLVRHLRQVHLARPTSEKLVADIRAEVVVAVGRVRQLVVHVLGDVGVVVDRPALELHAQRPGAAVEMDRANRRVVWMSGHACRARRHRAERADAFGEPPIYQ